MLFYVLSELLHKVKEFVTYRFKVNIAEPSVVNLEEGPLRISIVSTAVLLLFLLNFPYLPQNDSPDNHILHESLLREDLI